MQVFGVTCASQISRKGIMKLLVLLCVIFAATLVRADETEDSSDSEEVFREEYCNVRENSQDGTCSSRRCNKDNTKSIGVACAMARCSGKPVGFKGDPTKPYPQCCMIPICDDSSK